MASIRKRTWQTPSGKVRTAWQVDYRDASRRRKSKQFETQAEARKWAEETDLRAANSATYGKTVADAGEAWIERAEADELERSTLEGYQWALDFILPCIGKIPLLELTQEEVVGFKKELAVAKSASTAERTLHVLKMIINHAVDAGWVGRNVAHKLRSSKSARHLKAQRRKIIIPSRDDLRAMIKQLDERADAYNVEEYSNLLGQRSRALFMMLFETGVRPSELRGLAWPQVKFGRGAVEILQRVDKWNVMGDCKTHASYRHIPISMRLLTVLQIWKARCPSSRQNLVFPTASGKPISYRNLHREFNRLQITAGVAEPTAGADGKTCFRAKYTLKDMRHAAASWWIHKRIDLKDLTTRIGHSSIQVTFDVYGHVIEEAAASDAIISDLDDDLYLEATPLQHDEPPS